MRSKPENILYISSHVQLLKHFITFIQYEMLNVLQADRVLTNEGQQSTGCSNNNMRTVLFESCLILRNRQASEKHCYLQYKNPMKFYKYLLQHVIKILYKT